MNLRVFTFLIGVCAAESYAASNETFFLPQPSTPFVTEEDLLAFARQSPECRPAENDPEGNWGEPSEGFQLSLRFAPRLYTNREPIIFRCIMRNLSDRELSYRRAAPRGDMEITAWDGVGTWIPNKVDRAATNAILRALFRSHELGAASHAVAKGRQSVSEFLLNDWYTLSPGLYEVCIGWRVPKFSGEPGFGWVYSAHTFIEIVGSSNAPAATPQDRPSTAVTTAAPASVSVGPGDAFVRVTAKAGSVQGPSDRVGIPQESTANSPAREQLATGGPSSTFESVATSAGRQTFLAILLALCAAVALIVLLRRARRRSE